jgi:hypothetical protein
MSSEKISKIYLIENKIVNISPAARVMGKKGD